MDLFSLIVLQDPQLLAQVNPYLLSCAVVAASRRSNGLIATAGATDWPQELEKLSGLASEYFQRYTVALMQMYHSKFVQPETKGK